MKLATFECALVPFEPFLVGLEHSLVISEPLGVFPASLAETLFEMRLHDHCIFQIAKFTPDAFQRGIDTRIAAERNIAVSVALQTGHRSLYR
ncbi:MAG: hypothetical protein ACRD4O_18950 [Bryobacteraceae bacterium]